VFSSYLLFIYLFFLHFSLRFSLCQGLLFHIFFLVVLLIKVCLFFKFFCSFFEQMDFFSSSSSSSHYSSSLNDDILYDMNKEVKMFFQCGLVACNVQDFFNSHEMKEGSGKSACLLRFVHGPLFACIACI
jgi:hypothetical protein